MKATFLNYECEVRFGYYPNERIAIQLVSWDEKLKYFEPMATATINISTERLEDNEIIVKNYSENEGMEYALIDAGIVHPHHRTVSSGFVEEIPVCKLTDEALKEVHNGTK